MSRTYYVFAIFAALLGFYGVAAGAIAAHAIADPHAAARISTASLYALIHAAVLLGWREECRWSAVVKTLFVCGILLFSGSLTLTYALGVEGAVKLAPVGGTILLMAWFALGVDSIRLMISSARRE